MAQKLDSVGALELIDLVASVYEAGLDSTRWSTFLKQVSRAVNAEAGTIFIHDFGEQTASFEGGSSNVAAFVGFDDSAVVDYAEHYNRVNVWQQNEDMLGPGRTVTGSLLYPDPRLKRTEFYADWLRHQDLFYSLGGVVEKKESLAVKMSFLRAEGAGAYQPQELYVIDQLMPHLQAAVAMHRRMNHLSALAASAVTAVDSLSLGVVLLGYDGTFLHANPVAARILKKTGALTFSGAGALSTLTHTATLKLRKMLQDAAMTGSGRAAVPGGSIDLLSRVGAHVHAHVVPMPASLQPFGERACAALLLYHGSEQMPRLARCLQETYRLSRAEAALLEAIVSGRTLREFSDERRTSINTVRTQLKSVCEKVGVKRQADLVRVVLTGPAILHLRTRAEPD